MIGASRSTTRRSHRKAVVFVGPSLLTSDVDRIDRTRFDVRPPVRRGDIPRVVEEGYSRIGIIDGEFFQRLAVSPKEILAALSDGCAIVGGASMGALRGAELHTHGMTGVGQIFRWYRSGEVTRDDDVAVTYSVVEGEYLSLSTPMVNVRWVSRRAGAEGWLDPASRRRISAAARRIPWTGRTWRAICRRADLGEEITAAVLGYAADPDHNLKRLDALAVLEALTAPAPEPAGRR